MKTAIMKGVFESQDVVVFLSENTIPPELELTQFISIACCYNTSYEYMQDVNLLIFECNNFEEQKNIISDFTKYYNHQLGDSLSNPWFEYYLSH